MSETKEIKQDSPATKDIGDTVVVSPTKTGETTYKQIFSTETSFIWKYEGELNNENVPHGRGTITRNDSTISLEWRNGTPLVGGKMKYIIKNKMEFEGELHSLGLVNSEGELVSGWTLKGTALFPLFSGSFTGIMNDGHFIFTDGVFETKLLTIRVRTTHSSLSTLGEYTPSKINMIIYDKFSKRTYYCVAGRLFYNRNGVTSFYNLNASEFVNQIYTQGNIFNVSSISYPLMKGSSPFIHNYTPDEELKRMAGFSDE